LLASAAAPDDHVIRELLSRAKTLAYAPLAETERV